MRCPLRYVAIAIVGAAYLLAYYDIPPNTRKRVFLAVLIGGGALSAALTLKSLALI
jgi:hypothetical protein